ncbi:MAG: CAP domain-containing protein [Gemmatimonadota bacterium]
MPRIGLLCALALVVACGDDGPTGPGAPAELELAPEVAAFVASMNSHRIAEGCAALEWDVDVEAVATAHSQDMVDRSFFSHTNPDGDGPGDRLAQAEIDYSGWAENIAAGYTSGESVLGAWLNSSGHRANIENCSLMHHGVGLVDTHWTHVFLRP